MFPYQLVCEGKADQVFFSRMLQASGKEVDVICPHRDDGGMGKTGIRKVLIGLQAQFDKITRVVVLFDCDDDPDTAVVDAGTEFQRANEKNPAKPYPVPVTANTVATLVGSPDTAIVLVPATGVRGCLDTLLLPSFEQKFAANLGCVDDFCTCMADPARGLTKDTTLRLRTIIAAAYPKKPGASLANLLEEKHCPIELTHNSFDAIRAALAGLFP
jgi:hypothetical protein